jgi:superfamily II DNA/RNA helicase
MLDMGFEPQIRKIVEQIRVSIHLSLTWIAVFVLICFTYLPESQI